MATSQYTGTMQRAAGVVTWAVVTGLALYIVLRRDGSTPNLTVIVPLALLNLGAMWVAMREVAPSALPEPAALWLQLITALAVGALLPLSFMPIYSIIWIAMAAGRYSLRQCLGILLGVMTAWYAIMRIAWGEEHAIVTVALYATFHLFALLSARNAREAVEAHEQVEQLNRHLMATQHLLSEASRQQERTRIARNLHDLLGHHLTALSLNLQIAEHLTDGEAREKVEQARALARLLLSDVRDAVSTLREDRALDFNRAMQLLVENLPRLQVQMDIDEGLVIDDLEVAEALLRCVQEAMTNTLRHADASELRIRLRRSGDEIVLDVSDNGSLVGELEEGNGLLGMRERLALVGGKLQLLRPAQALQLRISVPLPT